ncbi:histone-lysine N-methyltransferase SETMAR [Trichonephila clavipes]|nr:histone-lysine N-methyltransferase SETMAR [Trichonephila clavipes]
MQLRPNRNSELQHEQSDYHRPNKFKAQLSAGKIMLTEFFDTHGLLLLKFKEPDVYIHAQRCSQTLHKLHRATKITRPGMLSGVIILLDNARPHVTKVCIDALARKQWEVLEHLPYSPNLSHCNYQIFRLLKKSLMGQRFHYDNDVKAALLNWFHDQPTSFFADGTRNFLKQWDTSLNTMGDFF